MPKIKTSELTGLALNWAVAKCEGVLDNPIAIGSFLDGIVPCWDAIKQHYAPSTTWFQGGPIIEREWLDITPWPNEPEEELRWKCKQHDSIDCVAFGPTPLIAAMRCLVASKLGEEVEIPEELT